MAPATVATLRAGPGHMWPAAAGEVEHGGGHPRRRQGGRAGPSHTTTTEMTQRIKREKKQRDSQAPSPQEPKEVPSTQVALGWQRRAQTRGPHSWGPDRAAAPVHSSPPPWSGTPSLLPQGRSGCATVAGQKGISLKRKDLGDI